MAVFGLFLFLILGGLAWQWLRRLPPPRQSRALIGLGLILAIPLAGYLILTGRIHVIGLGLAAAYPLVRRFWPQVRQILESSNHGKQSTVSADILEMTLDHDSGTMEGRILQGPYNGKMLADLSESDLMQLLAYCRHQDSDSARLLETYLDRRYGADWRDSATDSGSDEQQQNEGNEYDRGPTGEPSREEALEILGLEPGATAAEIIQAHRRLMQKLHPDRGGSAYLAARINAARRALLKGAS